MFKFFAMIQSQAETLCSGCGEKTVFTIYKSINVAENPELKKKVADGSLFLWECPHCGKVNLAAYETLYHDPQKKLMLWLDIKNQISDAQMEAISNHTKAMGGYTLRIVSNVGSLIEKLRIFEDGLDDLAIEFCKWVTKQEMSAKIEDAAKLEEINSQKFHYHHTEGEEENRVLCFSVVNKNNVMEMKIGWNVYEDACGIIERNPAVRPAEGFCRIDADYLNSIIR